MHATPCKWIIDSVAGTGQIDHYVGGQFVTSYSLAGGLVTLSARTGIDSLGFDDFGEHMNSMQIWIDAIRRAKFEPAKTQVDYHETYDLVSPADYKAVFKISNDKIMDVAWDGALLAFKPRPQQAISWSAFLRWIGAMGRVQGDIAGI